MAENNHKVDTFMELCLPVLHSPDKFKDTSNKPATKPFIVNVFQCNNLKFMDRTEAAAVRFLLENTLLE